MKKLHDQIIEEYNTGSLLPNIFEKYWRRSEPENKNFVKAVAKAHNGGKIDFLSLVEDPAYQNCSTHSHFNFQHFFDEVLPDLEAPALQVMRAVDIVVRKSGDDLAANMPNGEFAKWCAKDEGRSEEIVLLAKGGDDLAVRFLSFALQAGSKKKEIEYVSLAIELSDHPNRDVRLPAINGLRRMTIRRARQRLRVLEHFDQLIDKYDDDLVRANIVGAAVKTGTAGSNRIKNLMSSVLEKMLVNPGAQTLHQLAAAIAFDTKEFDGSLIKKILNTLDFVDAKNTGTIDHIDHALRKLAEQGSFDLIWPFLESVILRESGPLKLKQFDSFIHQLFSKERSQFPSLMTRWFRTGKFELCSQLQSIFQNASLESFPVQFDALTQGIDESEGLYLARKAVGFLFLRQITAASYILSLARSFPNQGDEYADLLFDPLLMNYSGKLADYLKEVAESDADDASSVAQIALDKLDSYLKGLREVGDVKELYPTDRQRQLEWQRHQDSMSESYKEAQKKSFFASLVSHRILLYGTRSISYHQGLTDGEEARRIETEMHSHSVSVEAPRVDTIDTLGLNQKLLSFRVEAPEQ